MGNRFPAISEKSQPTHGSFSPAHPWIEHFSENFIVATPICLNIDALHCWSIELCPNSFSGLIETEDCTHQQPPPKEKGMAMKTRIIVVLNRYL
jgi:hypothetical protein